MGIFAAIVGLGLLVAVHEAGHYALARILGMRVVRFSVGFGPGLWSWTSPKTGIAYQVGVLPLGGFVQIAGMNPFEEGADTDPRSYQRQPKWKPAAVLAAGPVANLVMAWMVLFVVMASVGVPVPADRSAVGTVFADTPAAAAGLRPGDRIVAVEGRRVTTFSQLRAQIQRYAGVAVTLVVERDGRRRPVRVVPEDRGGIGVIGIGPPERRQRAPVGLAAWWSLKRCGAIMGDTLGALWGAITGTGDVAVETAGPPKIIKMAAAQLDRHVSDFAVFLAFISLMLALFNLLPVPALDGGRLTALGIEAAWGRPLPLKVSQVVNTVFFFLIVAAVAVLSVKELLFE